MTGALSRANRFFTIMMGHFDGPESLSGGIPMLVYLKYILVPRKENFPSIRVISKMQDCLAFRCSKSLSQGLNRVSSKTSSGLVSFEVDVYQVEERTGLYEARIVLGSQLPMEPKAPSLTADELGLFGEMEERFASGISVRVSRAVEVGSFLRVEIDGTDGTGLNHFAEVLWAKELAQGAFDVRLNYVEQERLMELSDKDYVKVSVPELDFCEVLATNN